MKTNYKHISRRERKRIQELTQDGRQDERKRQKTKVFCRNGLRFRARSALSEGKRFRRDGVFCKDFRHIFAELFDFS